MTTFTGGIGSGLARAKEALIKRKENLAAKKEKAGERRSLRKTHRKQRKEAIKTIRKSDDSKEDKKLKIGERRAFHRVKKGEAGGFAAAGKYGKKMLVKKEKKEARVAKRTARKEARNA
jgi:hypothetical protein